MGGHALSCGSVRIKKEDFLVVCDKVVAELQRIYPNAKFAIPAQMPDKDSFGDLDIIYTNDEKIISTNLSWLQKDGTKYSPQYTFINSDVISFDYKLENSEIFQIDLIRIRPECFNFAIKYYSYGDTGNIIGRAYKYAGLKLSHEGLKYKYVTKYIVAELYLTYDWQTALNFLEYPNYDEHEFKDIQSVFDYCFSTPFANHEIYMLENSNHVDRIRNVKRPMFMAMQDYINEHPNCTNNFYLDKETYHTEILERAFKQFPNFYQEYQKLVELDLIENAFRNKFNGIIVSDITGLKEKRLSIFMKDFIDDYDLKSLLNKELMVAATDIEIKQMILRFLKKWEITN